MKSVLLLFASLNLLTRPIHAQDNSRRSASPAHISFTPDPAPPNARRLAPDTELTPNDDAHE